MDLQITTASTADADAIATLRTATATDLTRRHGHGHWSAPVTDTSVLRAIATSHVLVARHDDRIVATVRLDTRKPWAIDLRYFTTVDRAVYLHDLAVEPNLHRHGIGRQLLQAAQRAATARPNDAIRLDAYDHPAGAGAFYTRCGFRQVGQATYRGVPLIYLELVLARTPR